MLIQKSDELEVDLNIKSENAFTAFHWACYYNRNGIVEMMIDNAKFYKLDLTAKDNKGRNGFQIAKHMEARKVVKLILKKY